MQTRPKIVLLDEVHTYHGVHGAQVAHVLRRWRHAVAAPVQFTGLSATLRDAVEFFSRLTGLHTAMVEEVSPTGEQIEEGMEYLLALRGDPVSGASLLSTTIQAAMLLRRMLEPNAGVPSTGLAGRRIYVFTDDLDVTNRLYHSLLDAEARNGFGVPIPGRQPLAALRAHARPDALERLLAGQSWKGSEFVGHDLSQPLIVTRTSSQDTGVARDADVIVATASLEVGYNDPEVVWAAPTLETRRPLQSNSLEAASECAGDDTPSRSRPRSPRSVLQFSAWAPTTPACRDARDRTETNTAQQLQAVAALEPMRPRCHAGVSVSRSPFLPPASSGGTRAAGPASSACARAHAGRHRRRRGGLAGGR